MRIEQPVDRLEPGIAAEAADLARLGQLSPFELRNQLTALATSHADRVMLNAGRGNPNFLAAESRHGFFQLGLFAMAEAERCATALPPGVAGLPERNGIAERFARFVRERDDVPGTAFLGAAMVYASDCLGVSADTFVHELAQGALGCLYPEPVRMLPVCEQIVSRYLIKEMTGGMVPAGDIDLFAVEGATAGITYLFNTLRMNKGCAEEVWYGWRDSDRGIIYRRWHALLVILERIRGSN